MRQLIGLQADPSQVEKAAEAMARWAGDDPRKRADLAEYSKLVLGLGQPVGDEAGHPGPVALHRLNFGELVEKVDATGDCIAQVQLERQSDCRDAQPN